MSELTQKEISFWDQTLSDLDQLVVGGQHDQCRRQMDAMIPGQVPRSYAAKLAQMASRIQHSVFASKILYRFVFPENSFDQGPTDSEKTIYAYALLNLGAADEAHKLLDTVDSQKDPDVLFQKALAYVNQWNYRASIPLLKDFIASEKPLPYRKLVAEVNLVAALICESEWQQVDLLLKKIIKTCEEQKYTLLLGNSYELQAQSYFFQKKFDAALASLDLSLKYLKDQKGIYLFFVEKWRVLCLCFQNPSPDNLSRLSDLREQSMTQNYWDTTREFDFFKGILMQDEQLIRQVIMGTPSESYRELARSLCGKNFRSRGRFAVYAPEESAKIHGIESVFDPYTLIPGQSSLADKPQLLALYKALTLDFYRPSYIGALFKSIYAGERFNPSTSPARVIQLLRRLDRWFKENKWPLKIQFKKSEFRLLSLQPTKVVVQRGSRISAKDVQLTYLRKQFMNKEFSSIQVCESLSLSKSASLGLIKMGLQKKVLMKTGLNRSTNYRFVKAGSNLL